MLVKYRYTLYQVNLVVPALSLAIHMYVPTQTGICYILLYMAVDDFYMNIHNVIQDE